jgi:hypothetical protein
VDIEGVIDVAHLAIRPGGRCRSRARPSARAGPCHRYVP